MAWGNALEDHGLLLGLNENYQKALEQFGLMLENARNSGNYQKVAKAHVAIGRCMYRKAEAYDTWTDATINEILEALNEGIQGLYAKVCGSRNSCVSGICIWTACRAEEI